MKYLCDKQCWVDTVDLILRYQLLLQNIKIVDLHTKLQNLGVEVPYKTLVRDLNRGTISAARFIQCIAALEIDIFDIQDRINAQASSPNWRIMTTEIIRDELKNQHLKLTELVDKLADIGIVISYGLLKKRLRLGNFSAAFFLQCFVALDIDILDIKKILQEKSSSGIDQTESDS